MKNEWCIFLNKIRKKDMRLSEKSNRSDAEFGYHMANLVYAVMVGRDNKKRGKGGDEIIQICHIY
jgi:hypothetical protein